MTVRMTAYLLQTRLEPNVSTSSGTKTDNHTTCGRTLPDCNTPAGNYLLKNKARIGSYINFCPAPHQLAHTDLCYHLRVIARGEGHLFL